MWKRERDDTLSNTLVIFILLLQGEPIVMDARIRVRPRFFDQVEHKTMYASSGNKYFSLNLVIVRLIKIMNRAVKNLAQI